VSLPCDDDLGEVVNDDNIDVNDGDVVEDNNDVNVDAHTVDDVTTDNNNEPVDGADDNNDNEGTIDIIELFDRNTNARKRRKKSGGKQ
jgi:hypothetical protein